MSASGVFELHRRRAAREREMASRAAHADAQRAHLNLAIMHERAADRAIDEQAS